jgi:hypothetical protein
LQQDGQHLAPKLHAESWFKESRRREEWVKSALIKDAHESIGCHNIPRAPLTPVPEQPINEAVAWQTIWPQRPEGL